MILLDITFYLLTLYFVGATLYLAILTVAAYLFTKKANQTSEALKVAIVIPAHNEEFQIEATIRSIRDSRYPDDKYEIFVIADNCKDQTAFKARAAGALVSERTDKKNRGKGQALDWFFKTREIDYDLFDAIVIIDADTLIDVSFLSEISISLSHPEVQVVQGFYGVLNPKDNWRTAIASAALDVFHHIRPSGRNRIGGTAGLKGNGMGFKSDIIREYGWPAYSIVEDIEFSMRLLLDNILVYYNNDAIVYGEMPTKAKQSETQRNRWESGRFQVFKEYGPSILNAYFKSGKIQFFDGFMDLFVPPLSILVLGQGLLLTLSIFFYPLLSVLFLFCFIAIGFYVFSGLFLKRAPFYVWRCLIASPFFLFWKILVYVKLLGKGGEKTWERTQRKSELKERNRE